MSYVLTWPSDRGPCCLSVPASTFFAIVAADPRGVRVGSALQLPGPARGKSTPAFFETSEIDWVGCLCLLLAAVCLAFGFYELSELSGQPFEPPSSPVLSATKLV